MINVILNGACGRLGTTFQKVAKETTDVNIVAGVDINRTGISTDFPLYKNIKNVAVPADAVVDFSTPTALDEMLDFCVENHLKLLVATTGHSEIQNEKIAAAAKKIAVFKAANLSHGVYVLSRRARGVTTRRLRRQRHGNPPQEKTRRPVRHSQNARGRYKVVLR